MLTTRTEQESRQAPPKAPARGIVPKTGQRRPEAPHPAKPVPQPRPETDRRRPRPESGPSRGRPAAQGPRPAVQRRPARRQRAPFVLLVVGLLCGGLVSLLLLNTVLARDSIAASRLVDEISTARQQNEQLQREIEQRKQPDVIAEQAEDLGMKQSLDSVNPYTTGSTETGQAVQGR
ncbi:hypothetical protein GCM10012278_37780 [Nonomuraea glycinis]|uniref:Cell division protein FtsL n=1 Tax=Nonomuraea glycinis TaxID=2047744 RepID=A0A918A636_9ACTN|nr:hypothetical protein GCM10012278_37780 [Nonomuraea glycinis]